MELMECDELVGRMRSICRHEAGLSLDGKNSTNAYRESWGKWPINEDGSQRGPQPTTTTLATPRQTVKPEPVLGQYPGTNLAYMLKDLGVKVKLGCSCEEWIKSMNAWGPDGCVEHKPEIVERLAEKSKEISLVQTVKIGVMMIWKGMLPTISQLVDQAIDVARKARAEAV